MANDFQISEPKPADQHPGATKPAHTHPDSGWNIADVSTPTLTERDYMEGRPTQPGNVWPDDPSRR